jgi:pimeloyl-ACP methyl ester carboxylesterase
MALDHGGGDEALLASSASRSSATIAGGGVGHRLALDHPDKVAKLAVLDILPTYYLYTHVTLEFIQAYFHWFNYVRAGARAGRALEGAVRVAARKGHHRRGAGIPSRPTPIRRNIHGMCEDYRASASDRSQARRGELEPEESSARC